MIKHKKTLLKTLTWRVSHTVVSLLISAAITNSFKFAAEIVSAEVLWESALFYLHERSWLKFDGENK